MSFQPPGSDVLRNTLDAMVIDEDMSHMTELPSDIREGKIEHQVLQNPTKTYIAQTNANIAPCLPHYQQQIHPIYGKTYKMIP